MPKSLTRFAALWPPTADVAREADHEPHSPLRAIRAKRLDCSCYQVGEIRLCEAVKCPLWPFRAGKHPWRATQRKTPFNPPDFHDGEAIQDGKSLARWKALPRGAGRTPMPGGGQ
jgi:hypothetical protein